MLVHTYNPILRGIFVERGLNAIGARDSDSGRRRCVCHGCVSRGFGALNVLELCPLPLRAREQALHHFAFIQLHGTVKPVSHLDLRIDPENVIHRGADVVWREGIGGRISAHLV
jgi:hypothetical protein